MKCLKAINSWYKRLRNKFLARRWKRKIETAHLLVPEINGYLHRMGYNRGARRRFWREFIKGIEKLEP